MSSSPRTRARRTIRRRRTDEDQPEARSSVPRSAPPPCSTSWRETRTLGVSRAVVKWGFLRGVDRPFPPWRDRVTSSRSGRRADQVAYDVAKAIDQHRDALKWYIRPYSYDPRTVWADQDVPLHPGAERFYREAGYSSRRSGLSRRRCFGVERCARCCFHGRRVRLRRGNREVPGAGGSLIVALVPLLARTRRKRKTLQELSTSCRSPRI